MREKRKKIKRREEQMTKIGRNCRSRERYKVTVISISLQYTFESLSPRTLS